MLDSKVGLQFLFQFIPKMLEGDEVRALELIKLYWNNNKEVQHRVENIRSEICWFS